MAKDKRPVAIGDAGPAPGPASVDTLFKGCTRPAMVAGVPVVPLMIVGMVVILLSVWSRNILYAAIMLPIWLIMRHIAKNDDQAFRLLGLKLWCRVLPNRNKNARFWKASTYSPVPFARRKE